jgi:hypothetical protein
MSSNYKVEFNKIKQTPTPSLVPSVWTTTIDIMYLISTPDGSAMYITARSKSSFNVLLYKSTDKGVTWNTTTEIVADNAGSVISNNGVFLKTSTSPNLGTYRSTNYGASYTRVTSLPSILYNAAAISSNGEYQVVGIIGTSAANCGAWRATSKTGGFTKILNLPAANENEVINSVIVSDDGLRIAVCVYNGIYISSSATIGTTPVFTKTSGPGGSGNPSTVDYSRIAATSNFSKIVVVNEQWLCWCGFSPGARMERFPLPALPNTQGWLNLKVISTDGSTDIMCMEKVEDAGASQGINGGIYLSLDNCTTATKITNNIVNPNDNTDYNIWKIGAFIPTNQSIITYTKLFNLIYVNNFIYTYKPITQTGSLDLLTIFKTKGTNTAAVTGYKVNNVDLNTLLAPISDGVSIGYNTGYTVNGKDLSTIFASK